MSERGVDDSRPLAQVELWKSNYPDLIALAHGATHRGGRVTVDTSFFSNSRFAMHTKELGEPLLVKLIRSSMTHALFSSKRHVQAHVSRHARQDTCAFWPGPVKRITTTDRYLRKASKSRFISSACVQEMPCGPPSSTTSRLPLMASCRRFPVAGKGRIRSASP